MSWTAKIWCPLCLDNPHGCDGKCPIWLRGYKTEEEAKQAAEALADTDWAIEVFEAE